jgi:hypothetical protein
MPKRSSPIHYGKRYEVSGFIPPETMARIAEERTSGMADFFIATASRDGLKWCDQLHRLAQSCYMQGINDSVESIFKAGLEIVKKGESNDR